MHIYPRVLLVTLLATVALAALISSASARNLSVSNQNIRVAWSSLEFVAEATNTTVRCGLTLEGSFHSRTIAKVERSLIGYITRASFRRPCTGGTAWTYNGTEVDETRAERPIFANSLPWHLTYERFEGALPNITRVTMLVTGMRYRIRATIFGIPLNCDYTTSSTENARGTATRNVTTGVIDNVAYSGSIRSSSGGACPTLSFGSRSEDGIITLLGATTKLTLTLI
jgi:hypothetical protein